VLGIRQSALTNSIIVAVKVGIVVLVIGFGAFYITADYWHPFIPENTGLSHHLETRPIHCGGSKDDLRWVSGEPGTSTF
jgi:amino acid transporter